MRRQVLFLSIGILIVTAWRTSAGADAGSGVIGQSAQAGSRPSAGSKLVGMYVHQHWPYNRPYAARTWTIEDWRGYADGLTKLAGNFWPLRRVSSGLGSKVSR